jgi:putative ABC transport system ATP-binding protein
MANQPRIADSGAADYAVRLNQVSKHYGTGDMKVTAVNQVTVDVNFGELTLLVGPSGCGKTTLISMIAGLLEPSEGELEVLGKSYRQLRGGRKVKFRGDNIGFVFQQYNLLPALTVAENAAVPLLIQNWSRRKAVAKACTLLDAVGLGNRLDSYPAQLSGGQQQRVAIARALVHEPKLLVCDEPTAALDAKSGQAVMELLKNVAVKTDRAVMIVTHDFRVYRFGDRMLEMADGALVAVRSRDEIQELIQTGHH